ncbi:Putative portal protein [Gordonia phage GMA5]|uniref:Putative portal protein n=1 Tax=Gordonia phage GMA5 TaxID=1647472 RepID=A0A0K0MX57_9CAUD|nr:putative portal protein [Gordonia phage GMA5]AKI28618.1 Putative portal protein [Gordonia phage GMA5]
MTFLDRVRAALAAPAAAQGQVRFLSPYDDTNHLWPIVAGDWVRPASSVTRAQAMSVPAVKRARGIICTTTARTPLRAYRGSTALDPQPLWIDRTDGPVSPYHRMVWTIDDLMFYGWSLWACARTKSGVVIAADRVPFDRWKIDDKGVVVYIDENGTETPADPRSVILIPGSDEGLLASSAGAIRHAADLLASASKASENPSAYIELHQTNDLPITEEQARGMIAKWAAARRGENGGVAFTSHGVEVREHGSYSEHLLVEGRNAAALDVARAVHLPGSALDATVEKSSLNYETTEGKTADLIDFGLSSYMSAITARLGMDDVVPRGTSVRFVLDAETGPDATAGTPDDGGASTPPAPTETGVSQ